MKVAREVVQNLSVVQAGAFAFLALRLLQRCFYLAKGHRQHLNFDPRLAINKFFEEHGIAASDHVFTASDGVSIKYSKIGSGPKLIVLCNGVGTGLFMWLPLFQEVCWFIL